MTPNRRYSEDEVQEILERATEAERSGRSPVPAHGMTLAELQAIGREVGIAPELIAEAATAIERRPSASPAHRRFLGTTIGVGRTVDLNRRLTTAEWERLVVDLRETFDARGRIREEGAFRQWTNGNLQALLEPTETGERLRLRTLKGDATLTLGGGAALLALAPFVLVLSLLGGDAELLRLFVPVLLGGGFLFGFGRVTLPKWADARQLQMDGVAARLLEAIDDSESAEPD